MEHQISFFDNIPLTWFEESMQRGSGFEGGKVRIYAAALNLSMSDFAKFLKDEYGMGGSSIKEGFLDYGPKGIRLYKFREKYEENYSWAEAAKTIKKLISIDQYLTDKQRVEIKEIQNSHDGILPCPKARYGFN